MIENEPPKYDGQVNDLRRERRNPTDVHVGARVYARRIALGLSPEDLALRLEMSPQDVRMCECGSIRISAILLHKLGEALEVRMEYFFLTASILDAARVEASSPSSISALMDQLHALGLNSLFKDARSGEVKTRAV